MGSGPGLGTGLSASSARVVVASDDTVSVQLSSATAANGDVLAKTGQLPSSVGPKATSAALAALIAASDSVVATSALFNAASLVAAATVGMFLIIINTNASNAQWVMVFDKASAPANGDSPVLRVRVNATSVLIVPLQAEAFANGVAVGESSTTTTFTASGGSDLHASYVGRNP